MLYVGSMPILTLLVVGVLVGYTGRSLTRWNAPGQAAVAILLGIAGAMFGALLGNALDLFNRPDEGPGILTAMLGAMTMIWGYGVVLPGRSRA